MISRLKFVRMLWLFIPQYIQERIIGRSTLFSDFGARSPVSYTNLLFFTFGFKYQLFASLLYCSLYNYPSSNFYKFLLSSIRAITVWGEIQIRSQVPKEKKRSKEIKSDSFSYRKVGVAITIWGAQDKILVKWTRSHNNNIKDPN